LSQLRMKALFMRIAELSQHQLLAE